MSILRMSEEAVKAHQERIGRAARKPEEKSEKTKEIKAPPAARSSEYENWLANQLVAAGLPEPARQFRWLDDRMLEADLAYPPLLIEIDGAAHRIKGRFMDDIEKNQQALINGYWLLRIATSQVRNGKGVEIVKAAMKRIRHYGYVFDVEHSK